MAQTETPQATSQSTLPTSLHPLLESALSHLDVNLEEELGRYRRTRRRRPIPPVGQVEYQTEPAVAAAATAGFDALSGSPHVEDPEAKKPQGLLDSSAEVFAAPSQQTITPNSATAFVDDPPTGENPDTHLPPDDYLASSEELLRSIAENEAELSTEPEPGLLQTLLTPLGIGSMLLLILTSVTFGVLLTSPESFRLLGLEKLFATPDPTDQAGQTGGDRPETISGDNSVPVEPDLSAEEFVELDLSTLSRLPAYSGSPSARPPSDGETEAGETEAGESGIFEEAAPTTTTAPAPAPSTAALPSRPTSRPTSPAPAPAPSPAASLPRLSSPSPTPAPATPPTPTTAAAPATPQESLYYVITDYTGDPSLDQAREAVGDAYVRNFPNGARVQLGAFSSEAGAEELRRDLAAQGISAEIYQP
jgi:hypothetical protein